MKTTLLATRFLILVMLLGAASLVFAAVDVLPLANARNASTPTLEQLINQARENAVRNRIAAVRLHALQRRLDAIKNRSGIELFANAGWQHNQDVISQNATVNYQDVTAEIGLQVPLLGAASAQNKDIRTARLDTDQALQQMRTTQRDVAALVLEANTQWYFAQQRLDLTDAFLSTESQLRQVLERRTKAHLLLQSDQLEFLSAYDAARVQRLTDRSKAEALRVLLKQLSALDLSTYRPAAPNTFLPKNPPTTGAACINHAPTIQFAHARIDERKQARQNQQWEGLNAYLSVSRQFRHGIGVPSGGSTAINLNFTMPLNILGVRKATRDKAQLRVMEAQLQAQQASQTLAEKLMRAQTIWQERKAKLVTWNRQFLAAYAAWVIAEKRAHGVIGDTLERLQQARYALYKAAINRINAQQAQALAAIGYLRLCWSTFLHGTSLLAYGNDSATPYEPDASIKTTVPKMLATFAAAPLQLARAALRAPLPGKRRHNMVSLGWYVWRGHNALEAKNFWSSLPRTTRRLALSFNGDELRRLKSSAAERSQLRHFLAAAHRRNIRVVWLLGDPELALPAGRRFLRQWLPFMQDFRFEGIELDAERNQLPPAQRARWPAGILHSLTEIRQLSAWPISLSVNWRSLEIPGFAHQLADTGVSRIDVMLYVSNPVSVKKRMARLLSAYPHLHLALALSVETRLPKQNSLAYLGSHKAVVQALSIARALAKHPNFGGVMLQSWEDYYQIEHPSRIHHQTSVTNPL